MERMKSVIVVMSMLVIILLTACGGIDKDDVRDATGHLVEFEDGGVLYIFVNPYCTTPYYSPNGKLCHYVNGEIVEIE